MVIKWNNPRPRPNKTKTKQKKCKNCKWDIKW